MVITEYTQTFPTKEFLIELIRHDLSQKEIADYLGITGPAVSKVINNLGTSYRVRDFLDRLLRDMEKGKFKRLEDY